MSGNTIGAKYYSDGKRIAPMLIDFPQITKCNECNTIFWIKNATKLGTLDAFEGLSKNNENIQQSRFLTMQEYFEALWKKVHQSKAEERDIRISIWWTFNDRIRFQDEKYKLKKPHAPVLFLTEDEKKLWDENTYYLIGMLDQSELNDRIMIAELHRNMGKFERCMEIINSIENEDLNWLKEMFGERCRNKDPLVFRLNSEE